MANREKWLISCKVYVGNLSDGASKADIELAFSEYGPLRNVWVARNPPGFAFVEFEDERDAENACRHLDGTRIAGGRIKAEMSHGRSRRTRGGPPGFRGGPPPYPIGGPHGGPGRMGGRGGFPRGHYNNDYPYPPRHGGPRVGGGPGHHSFRYSRSRSNSLGKSPPRTARPRTPPSRSVSPERH